MDEMGCEYGNKILTVLIRCNRPIGCELSMIPPAPHFTNVTCEDLLKNTVRSESRHALTKDVGSDVDAHLHRPEPI